jgi:hypothetical protein
MEDSDFSAARGERLERRDRDTRDRVLKQQKQLEGVSEDLAGLRGEVRRTKEDLAGQERRITRVESRIGLGGYVCPRCGVTGDHYAYSCS